MDIYIYIYLDIYIYEFVQCVSVQLSHILNPNQRIENKII